MKNTKKWTNYCEVWIWPEEIWEVRKWAQNDPKSKLNETLEIGSGPISKMEFDLGEFGSINYYENEINLKTYNTVVQ